ncbi:MAG TPA: hypothetical protein VHX44_00010 [Planctomycetota bacterium]|nr:hypothetical protein [Planctomycetota bacterium]
MNQHQPRPGVSLRIVRMGRVVVMLLLCALYTTACTEDLIPPPPVVPGQVPPVEVPPPVEDPNLLDQVIIPDALILGNGAAEVEEVGEAVEPPAIAPPHSPAKPSALILRWDRYRTLVVIDTSAGLLKPCWIVTLSTMPKQIPTPRGPVTLARGQVVVAYRGQAYHDKDGVLHIDARRARLGGIMASNWSPDSFAITPAKEVSSHDDDPTHPSNSGEVEKEVSAETQRVEYRRLLFTALMLVEGNI